MAERNSRILIVDDEVSLALNLQDILSDRGYSTAVAHDGNSALSLCQDGDFDLGLVDIRLPDMSGESLIQDIAEICPGMGFIIMTGHATLDSTVRAVGQRNIIAYETKPLDMEHAIPLVDMVMGRRNLEAALRENEEKFRLLAEYTNDWEYWHSTSGQFLYVSPAVERITGYKPEEFLADNTLLSRIINPDDDDANASRIAKALAEDAPLEMEFRVRHRDGHEVWISHACIVIYGPDGKSRGRRATNRDITERKMMEEKLRKAYQRIEHIIESTNIGTWEWNVQTGETIFNEIWARFVGYTLDELAPTSIKTWESLTHPDDLRHAYELLERHFSGELPYYDCERRIKHKDGHWIWIQDRGRVISHTADGKPLMMYGTHSDITERKQAEEALRDTYSLLAISQRLAHIGSWKSELSTGKLSWSEEMYRILGFPEASPIYLDMATSVFPPDELTRFREAVASAIRGDAPYSMDYTIVRADGQVRAIHDEGEVLFDEHGKADWMLGTTQDITERKQADEEKRQFYRDTISSVTQGKLNLAHFDEVKEFIDAAELSLSITCQDDTTIARHEIMEYCSAKGLCNDRCELFESAVGEAMANAIKHAPEGRAYSGVHDGSIWVAVSDAGSGMSPFTLPGALLRRGFSTKASLGMGFTIMMEATDRILLCTGSHGTTIVLLVDIAERRPALTLDDFPDM